MNNSLTDIWYAFKVYIGAFGTFLSGCLSMLTPEHIMYAIGMIISVVFTVLTYNSNKRRNRTLMLENIKRTEMLNEYLRNRDIHHHGDNTEIVAQILKSMDETDNEK